jgi:hypothetical protein
VLVSTAVGTSNLTSRTSAGKSLTLVVMMEGRDILCLSVADSCIASGTDSGNMERRGDNLDARCMDYDK